MVGREPRGTRKPTLAAVPHIAAASGRRAIRPSLKPPELRTDPRGAPLHITCGFLWQHSYRRCAGKRCLREGLAQTGVSHARQPAHSSLCSTFQLPSLLFQPWLYYRVWQWDSLSGKLQGVADFFSNPPSVHPESSGVPITLRVPHPCSLHEWVNVL